MMIGGTLLQPASVAAEPNWRARIQPDSALVCPCAAAAGPAVAADPSTGGNQR
jgi:hypothetical protein